MKKFLLAVLIVLLLAVIGGVVFLFTLNADQYRPIISDQLQKALGKPVKIEKISFGWRSGIALSLRGLTIGSDPEFKEALIRVESANAVLNLAPLLNHEVQISSIYVNQPQIRLVRRANGTFLGFEPKRPAPSEVTLAGKSAKGNSSSNAAAVLSLLIDQIRVDSGEFVLVDESGPRVTETRLHDIDLKIDNAALDQPIGLDVKAAFLSSRQNVRLKSELKVSSRTQEAVLENLHGEIDLDAVDLGRVSELAPEASSSGLEQISGKVQIETNGRILLNEKALQNADASLQLQEGQVRLSGLASSIDHVNLDLGLQSGLIKIRKADADFAKGAIRAQGQVNLKTPKPLTAFEVNLQGISLGALMPPSGDPSLPQVKGVLSGEFQGTMAGSSGPEMERTAAGEGNLVVEQGVITNLNILREVFRKLSMIPGLVENLKRRLPENYQEKLNERDTVLHTVQVPFIIKESAVIFNKLEVQTDSFALQGGGSYGLVSKTVGAQANLFVEPDLSLAFIKSVRELEYLADRKSGALMIPMNIQGRVPQVSVSPDLQYIASRLAVAKTQDVLGSLLKSPQTQTVDPVTGQPVSTSTATSQTPAGESASTAKTKYPKGSQILGALLQSALQPDSGSSDSSNDNSNSQKNGSLF